MKLSFSRLGKHLVTLIILTIATITLSGCMWFNHPPGITSLEADETLLPPSGSTHIECIASDTDGDDLEYDWLATGGSIHSSGKSADWLAPDEPGIYTITVKVTDGNGAEATGSINIAVRGTVGDATEDTVKKNHPPQVNLMASEERVTPSSDCTITCEASDPDGDNLNYDWEASEGKIEGEGHTVTWIAPNKVGSYIITVVVTDGQGGKSTESLTIDVAVNHTPIIKELIAEKTGVGRGESCIIECVATDPDGDELSYAWEATGGEIDSTGEDFEVKWIAPHDTGRFIITVTVTDGRGGEAAKHIDLKVSC